MTVRTAPRAGAIGGDEALCRQIDALIEENEALRCRLQVMENALAQDLEPTILVGLTRLEQKILGLLVKKGGKASRNALFECLYGHDANGGPSSRVLDAHIYHLRKKLPPGVELRTLWGQGFELPAASLAILKREPT